MLHPFVRNLGVEQIREDSLLVEDLNVNSARLVDIVLEIEDQFAIRIDDEEVGALATVGGAIDLIVSKTRASVQNA
jgi:acyl carrier protein